VTGPTIRDGKAYYKLADIRPHPENYNRHSPEQVKLLKASLEKYGQTKPVVLWRNAEFNGQNGIPGDKWLSLAGEGLCEAAMQLGWQEVWGNDRSDLSVLEARAYLAVDNETARQADPDIDALSQLLAAVHAEDEPLAALAAGGEDELRRLLEMAGQEPMGEGEGYSRKVETPVYTPKNPKPVIGDLYDDVKTRHLIQNIEAMEGLADDERAFLRIAAQRHTVLHFNKIADYYAHSAKPMQGLMEESALVIIDFNKAIALGFCELVEDIALQIRDEYGT